MTRLHSTLSTRFVIPRRCTSPALGVLLLCLLWTMLPTAATAVNLELHVFTSRMIGPVTIVDKGVAGKTAIGARLEEHGAGRLTVDRDGRPLVTSLHREKGTLTSLDTGTVQLESKLLSGINRKALVATDTGWLVAVDYWPASGNNQRGIFAMSKDGATTQVNLHRDFNGLADLIKNPGAGWLFVDFEADNLYKLNTLEDEPTPLLTTDIPAGLYGLAYSPKDKTLYAVERQDSSFQGATSRLLRITDNTAIALYQGRQLEGIAVNSRTLFPPGLYFSDRLAGAVLRLLPDGSVAEVISGLASPSDLLFDPRDGSLLIICEDSLVLRVGPKGSSPPPAFTPFAPNTIEVARQDLSQVVVSLDSFTTASAPDGTAAFAGLPPGPHQLRIDHPGYSRLEQPITLRAAGKNRIELRLAPVTYQTLTGTVGAENGTALAGATVTFTPQGDKVGHNGPRKFTCDLSGAFTARELPEGDYRVLAEATGYTSREFTLSLPATAPSFEMKLTPATEGQHTASFKLTDALSGKPLAGGAVVLAEAGAIGMVGQAKADARGVATIANLKVGAANLTGAETLLVSHRQLTATITADGYQPMLIPFTLDGKVVGVGLMPLTLQPEKEPNNDEKTAQQVLAGSTVGVKIAERGDRDFFRFTLPQRAMVTVETAENPPLQTALRLLDPSGKVLRVENRYTDNQNRLPAIGLLPGDYLVHYEEWGNDAVSDQELALRILTEYTADPLEPNDTIETARPVGVNQEIRGTLLPRGDQDWFRLELERPGRLQLFMEPKETQRAVYLYRQGETKELTSKGVYSNSPLDLQSDLPAGSYLICVREWGDDAESLTPYVLRINQLADDLIDDPPAETLPLTAKRTLSVDGFASGTLLPRGDLDRFAIELPTAGRLELLGTYPEQLHLRLRSADGTTLVEQGTYANKPNQLRYETNGPATIYLEVLEWGNDASSHELYTITSTWLPADPIDSRQRNDDFATSAIIHAGDRLRNTILPLKDIDFYRIEVDHPGYLIARGKQQMQTHLLWHDSEHRELAAKGVYADHEIELAVPVKAGTYYLQVREWGDDSASGMPYDLEVIHQRAEPGEKELTDKDPVRPLQAGVAATFMFDQNTDIDLFTYNVEQPGPVVFTVINPAQTLVRVTDTTGDKVLYEKGFYAGNDIVIPLEIGAPTTLQVMLTEWGNDSYSTSPGLIIADREARKPVLAEISGVACGDSAGGACFALNVPEGVTIAKAELDTDLDGQFDTELDLAQGAEYTFPKPGIHQVDVRLTGDSGVQTVRRIWVDTRRPGESLEVELAIEGLKDGEVVEGEKVLTIFTAPSSGAKISRVDCILDAKPLATLHTPPFTLELPYHTMAGGSHTLEVTSFDSRGRKKNEKLTFELSEYFGLVPADKAEMTGENIRVSWSGDRFGDAVVQFRKQGESTWQKVTGESGRQRSVLLTGLVAGNQYEYQVLSGKKPSLVRTFTLLKGLAFGQPTYGVNINRDYDQRFGISVRNNGDSPLSVRLECGKPEDPLLLVGFVGEGSEDKPFTLAPGEERQFMLGLSAQDVETANHSFPVRIVSENGLSDEAMVNVSVRLPKVKLVWQDKGPAVFGLGRKLQVTNQGDTITDLAIFSDNPDVYIVPSINHGRLLVNSTIDVTAYPRLSEGFTGVRATLQARGLNKKFAHELEIKLNEGEKLYATYLIPGIDPLKQPQEYNRCLVNAQTIGELDPEAVDWQKAEFPEDQDLDGQNDRWYLMDPTTDLLWVGDDTDGDGKIDFVHADKGMDGIFEYSAIKVDKGWQRTNLVEAWLAMGFTLPWSASSYKEHDVDIIFNDQVIGVLRNTIPNGNYTFRLPPKLIRFNDNGMPEGNVIGINTKHLRGGHYVVNSDFRFNYRLTTTPVWSIGTSRSDAYTKALAIDGMSLEAPDYSISSSDMTLSGPEIMETGQERQVQAMIRNLGAKTSPRLTVALFDKRPNRDRQEISRVTLEDLPVSGKTPVALPWRTSGGEHQLMMVIDPDREENDADRTNNEAVLLVKVPGDDTPPELRLVSPPDGKKTDLPVTELIIEASDEGEVALVEASIDGGLWQPLGHRAGRQYTASMLLQPGSHQIFVRASDLTGNSSEQQFSMEVSGNKPEVEIIFPDRDSRIKSRTSNVVIKVPAEAVAAAARGEGSPWYRAKVAGGFGKVTVPLRFGSQEIEAMVIRQDGVVNTRKITVQCTRQPTATEDEGRKVQSSTSGQVSIYKLGEVDLFQQFNVIVAEPGD